jgi:pSer/pThr/pTyr-binding forkhead associated (FHA) protein
VLALRYLGFRQPAASPKPPIIGHPLGLVPGRAFLIPRSGLLLGRGTEAGLVIASERVARRHARLSWAADGSLVAEDLASTNGTQVDGVPLVVVPPAGTSADASRNEPPARPLRAGDILTIAAVFEFEVVDVE